MKTFRKLFMAPFVMILCLLASCDTDDLKDDIATLKNRVENLESYVNNMNKSLEALQTFIEGGKTIQSCEEVPQEDGTITYELTLSNGDVIALNQGIKGAVQYPPISIDEEGYWLIGGVRQEGCKAIGDNAAAPKFRVSEDGYWQVNVKGTDSSADYEYVYEPDGTTKVPARADATEGEEIKDFFEDVKKEGDTFYVKLADGSEFSLPIVEGLTAVIEKPTDGRWVEEDQEWMIASGGSTTKVVIKGDRYKHFVIAPAGWKAEISDIDKDGNANLTITPPVQGVQTRASADNTADVVLQVNKGLYWAVDKIKVNVGNPQTPAERYEAGKDIVIDGRVINKAMYGESVSVAEGETKEVGDKACVYFLESGATLEWKTSKPADNNKRSTVIVIGNSDDRGAVLKGITDPSWIGDDIYYNSTRDNNDPLFIMKNITVVNSKKFCFQNTTGNVEFIAENCELNLKKSMMTFDQKGKILRTFSVKNCTIKLDGNINVCDKPLGDITTSLIAENSIFYSSKMDTKSELFMGNFGDATLASIQLKNNIFMNLNMRGDAALIKAGGVSDVECSKNIFYNYSRYSNNVAVLCLGEFPNVDKSKWEDNIYYTSDSGKKLIPIYAYTDNPDCVFNFNFVKPDTPMESINESEGTYVLKADYAAYGPQK